MVIGGLPSTLEHDTDNQNWDASLSSKKPGISTEHHNMCLTPLCEFCLSAFDNIPEDMKAALRKVISYDETILPDVICIKIKINICNLLYRPKHSIKYMLILKTYLHRVSVQVRHLQCAQYARSTNNRQWQAAIYKVTRTVIIPVVTVHYVRDV
jgi:hypothetical protein